MRYIVNANNYITTISFGCYIECQDDGCTEYTGGVPTGYDSLDEWYADEAEKLYRWKIVNGQLTLDSSAVAPVDGHLFTPSSHATDKNNPHGVTAEQVGAAPAIGSADNPGCYCRTVDGVQEWVNPPMLVGEEYRTTERWDDKPVYRKMIQYTNATALSGNALWNIPHGLSNLDRSYGVEITCRTNGYQIPYVGTGGATAVTGCSATNIELTTSGDNSWSAGRAWYFDMKYVKAT